MAKPTHETEIRTETGDKFEGHGVGDWLREREAAPQAPDEASAAPGGLIVAEADIELNAGRPVTQLNVRNTGDRPIQVGSHFHFFETNRALEFDREAAFGKRLDIPAATAVRFEPGDQKDVALVPMGGKQHCFGFNDLVNGWTGEGAAPDYSPNRILATQKAAELGFKSTKK
jgi:urease subunit beta